MPIKFHRVLFVSSPLSVQGAPSSGWSSRRLDRKVAHALQLGTPFLPPPMALRSEAMVPARAGRSPRASRREKLRQSRGHTGTAHSAVCVPVRRWGSGTEGSFPARPSSTASGRDPDACASPIVRCGEPTRGSLGEEGGRGWLRAGPTQRPVQGPCTRGGRERGGGRDTHNWTGQPFSPGPPPPSRRRSHRPRGTTKPKSVYTAT